MRNDNVRDRSRAQSAFFYVLVAFVSLAVGYYLSAFMVEMADYRAGIAPGFAYLSTEAGTIVRAVLIAAVVFALMTVLDRFSAIGRWLIRYRYVISAVVLVLCCVFEISGSSVAMWAEYLDGPRAEGTLFGIPRSIRSDEWDVSTPINFSQVETGNLAVSPAIGGGGTDVTLMPVVPAWCFTTLFRPFLWGFMVLGASRGLSFLWVGRLLVLALLTFEIARLLTNRNDALSAAAAVLVTLSPVVQWWSSLDMLIYGQGLVLCLNAMLRADSRLRRWVLAVPMWYLFSCYVLVLYPAWMVPLFYIFAAMGIWTCHTVKKERGVSWGKVLKPIALPMIAAFALMIACVAFVLWQASDVLAAVSGTVYPGQRSESGGDGIGFLKTYLKNTSSAGLSPLAPSAFMPNVCAAAAGLALFPLGLVLLVVRMIKRKDFQALYLLAPYAFFLLYGVVGFPGFLARITLMSNVTVERLVYPMAYLDVMMLVYALAFAGEGKAGKPAHGASGFAGRGKARPAIAVVLAFAFASLCLVVARVTLADGASTAAYVLLFGILLTGGLAVLVPSIVWSGNARMTGSCLLAWSVVVTCVGICVNPVQQGVAALTESGISKDIQAIIDEDPDGLWVAGNNVDAQSCISNGAKTINCVNSYPNLDTWHTIDPDGSFEDVYNRYAHIACEVADDTSFALVQDDLFIVRFDEEDIIDLGIDYWLSREDMAAYSDNAITFQLVASDGDLKIYKVVQAEGGSR